MTQHTPFPWRTANRGNGKQQLPIYGDDGTEIAVLTSGSLADAALILQIPAMLDALRLAYTRIFNHRIDDLRDPEATVALDRAALDAIKKVMDDATGVKKYPCAPAPSDPTIDMYRAAPKLLEALEYLVQSKPGTKDFEKWWDTREAGARAAIAAAKGDAAHA